jgi:hypothetical protein
LQTKVDILNEKHYHFHKRLNESHPAMQIDYAAEANGFFDPDLPTASAVLVSLSCVATRYAANPSEDLALLGCSLAQTLTAPEYAESGLIKSAAKQLLQEWQALLQAHQEFAMQQAVTDFVAQSSTLQ